MQDVVHVFKEISLAAEPLDEFFHHRLGYSSARLRLLVFALACWLDWWWVDRLKID